MTCESVEPQLLAYAFGTTEIAEREGLEAHLGGCLDCVRRFIALKRALEVESVERPSELTRARIRNAAARQILRARPARRAALFVGVCAAAAALVLGIWFSSRPPPEREGVHGVDSAMPTQPLNAIL